MNLINKFSFAATIRLLAFGSFVVLYPLTVPAQNAGPILIPFTSAHANSQTGCFASTNGWDKYIVMTNIFIGPDYSLQQLPAGGVANTNHCKNLVLDLCNSSNGSALVAELYVVNNFHPSDGESKCGTVDPTCTFNANSSTNLITMTNTTDASYRVTVVYKSSTTNGIPGIVVNWAYANP